MDVQAWLDKKNLVYNKKIDRHHYKKTVGGIAVSKNI